MKVGGVSDISGEMVNSVSHDTLPVDTGGQARPLTDISSPAFPSPQSCLLVIFCRDREVERREK